MSKVIFDSEKITSRTLFISKIETDHAEVNIIKLAMEKIRREINGHIPPTFQYFILILLDYEFIGDHHTEIRAIDHGEDRPFDGRITCSWYYLPEPIYRRIMEFISRQRLVVKYLDGLKIITSQQWQFWLDEKSSP